jgi:hypothetical protein
VIGIAAAKIKTTKPEIDNLLKNKFGKTVDPHRAIVDASDYFNRGVFHRE